MKRNGKIVGWSLCFPQLECPFCASITVFNETMPWCTACGVEYYLSRKDDPKTGRSMYIFDNRRKTERFAWAKAIIAAGGVKIR